MAFPNFVNKQDYHSMLEPQVLLESLIAAGKVPRRKPPEGVVFCYDSRLMDYVRTVHACETESFSFSQAIYPRETRGRIAVIGSFGIGAPAAAALLELLIAFGVKRFISIGTAGSLQKNIGIGQIVVCNRAIRDEGVSHHYLPSEKFSYPSEVLTQRVVSAFHELNVPFEVGTSWTTDAIYRETVEEARHYQMEGVATVEMEAAALFSVASFRKVSIASILTVSDSLAHLKWEPHFYHERTERGLETLYHVAIQTLIG